MFQGRYLILNRNIMCPSSLVCYQFPKSESTTCDTLLDSSNPCQGKVMAAWQCIVCLWHYPPLLSQCVWRLICLQLYYVITHSPVSPPPGPDQALCVTSRGPVTSWDLTEKTCSIVHRFYILAQHPILAILRLLGITKIFLLKMNVVSYIHFLISVSSFQMSRGLAGISVHPV